MIISNTELEALRECRYNQYDIGMVSDRAYLSIVMTNDCNKNCFYCINSATDRSLQLPVDKAIENIRSVVAKYGIRVNTGKDRFPEEVKKQCSPEIIKEIDEIDRNNYINKITLSKNPKTYKFPYTIFILTWEVWRGRWGHVDVPDEKTLGELIPQDLWEIFMMER